MNGVPHLQELSDKFRDRGFEIVAVSSEAAATIQTKFVEGKSATFGVVKANISAVYETRGIPHCWVLDAEGKCIFKGHPNGVKNEMVEEWVSDLAPTKVGREVARELKNAAKAFDGGDLGKAQSEARKAAEGSEDEAVKSDAAYIEGLVQKNADVHKAKVEKARSGGDAVALGKALAEASERLKGTEQGNAWKQEHTELTKSSEFKDSVKASDDLEKLKPKLEDMKKDRAKKSLEAIAKKYPETKAGKEAAELAKSYE